MSRLVRVFLVLAAVVMTTVAASSAAFATGIPYSGRLTDAAGNPITGARDLTMTFYVSGAVVYSETFTAVSVANGFFNLELGTGTPVTGTFAAVNFASYDVTLGITVAGDAEMTPRVHMGFSPYSLSSLTSPGMSASHSGSSASFPSSGVATLASTSITTPRDGVIIVMVEGQLFLGAGNSHDVWISESNSGTLDISDYGIVSNPGGGGGFFQFSRFRIYRKPAGSYSFFLRGDSTPNSDYLWQPNMVALFVPLQMGPVAPTPAESMVPVRDANPVQQPVVH